MDLVQYIHDYDTRQEMEKALTQVLVIAQQSQQKQLREAIKQLLEWVVEDRSVLKGRYGYEKSDEKAPFFSEAYLYSLLGKEDARTLLALMRPIWTAAGIKREDQP